MSADYLLIPLAYLSGSLSAAVLVCKLMRLDDPRRHGSKNPGATNVLRLHGKKAAFLALFGDVLKGLLPVLLAQALAVPTQILALTALVAFLGHLYPVFFAFRGGKGIATCIGVLLGLHWPLGLAYIATWMLLAIVFRYSSLAGLGAALSLPVYVYRMQLGQEIMIAVVVMVLFMFWRHRSNIRKLLAGEEDKIGRSNTPAASGQENNTGR